MPLPTMRAGFGLAQCRVEFETAYVALLDEPVCPIVLQGVNAFQTNLIKCINHLLDLKGMSIIPCVVLTFCTLPLS